MIRPALILLAASAIALAACGKVGTLEQPAPMWGAKAKADYEAKKKAEAAAKADANKPGQVESLPPVTGSDTAPPVPPPPP